MLQVIVLIRILCLDGNLQVLGQLDLLLALLFDLSLVSLQLDVLLCDLSLELLETDLKAVDEPLRAINVSNWADLIADLLLSILDGQVLRLSLPDIDNLLITGSIVRHVYRRLVVVFELRVVSFLSHFNSLWLVGLNRPPDIAESRAASIVAVFALELHPKLRSELRHVLHARLPRTGLPTLASFRAIRGVTFDTRKAPSVAHVVPSSWTDRPFGLRLLECFSQLRNLGGKPVLRGCYGCTRSTL